MELLQLEALLHANAPLSVRGPNERKFLCYSLLMGTMLMLGVLATLTFGSYTPTFVTEGTVYPLVAGQRAQETGASKIIAKFVMPERLASSVGVGSKISIITNSLSPSVSDSWDGTVSTIDCGRILNNLDVGRRLEVEGMCDVAGTALPPAIANQLAPLTAPVSARVEVSLRQTRFFIVIFRRVLHSQEPAAMPASYYPS